MVDLIDRLKGEYAARSRGRVLERLLQELLEPDDADDAAAEAATPCEDSSFEDSAFEDSALMAPPTVADVSSLVLISGGDGGDAETTSIKETSALNQTSSGIDLPGFVSRRTSQLKESLRQQNHGGATQIDPVLSTVLLSDLNNASLAAEDHWRSLYGHSPGPTVVEAAVTWLARDVWSSTDASEGRPFTWSAANASVQDHCNEWMCHDPSLGRVMVVAGTLEDPFATSSLAERMPTLIRRFVNRFRRSRQVTSFETLESTMTVHGALKLLGLSTQAGTAVTLASIREAYKTRALEEHPDAGGSTDAMRRLNEAYRLLRELYRNR